MDQDEEPLAFPQLMSVSHYQRLSKIHCKKQHSYNAYCQVPSSNLLSMYLNQGVRTTAALRIRILGARQISLKDFVTVAMVYSSFKKACYNWSHGY